MFERHLSRWTAWAAVLIVVLIMTSDIVLSIVYRESTSGNLSVVDIILGSAAVSLVAVSFTGVGAFVVSRRPDNKVGWLMVLVGLGFVLSIWANDYPGIAGVSRTHALPLRPLVAWISTWIWLPYYYCLFLLLLLFPTGQPLSRRWRRFVYLGAIPFVLVSVINAIQQGKLTNVAMNNPLGLVNVPAVINVPVELAWAGCLLAAAGCLLKRLVVARGVERQQLKWFSFGAGVAIVLVTVASLSGSWGSSWGSVSWGAVLGIFALLGLTALPVFMGIAILRYRLYDIDLLINRTLVYGSLTAILGALYAGQIIVLQAVLRAVIGQQSGVAVAVSTLVVAALFNPLRRRLQNVIARAFYRRKYDATQVLASFGQTCRTETDLARLQDNLVDVVAETMQPSHVSLWLAGLVREGGLP